MANEIMYNDPAGGTASEVGSQIRTDYFYKKALVEAAKESYFGQMADVRAMPKHMGKTIKQYHYLPILDDRNLNDQGLDAAGAAPSAGTLSTAYIEVLMTGQPDSQKFYFRGDSTTSDAAALKEAHGAFVAWAISKGYTTTTITDMGADVGATFAELTDGSANAVSADSAGGTGGDYVVTTIAATATTPYGNLYGSSKDIGTIQGKIPALTETGGRVNRVGMKRLELEGTINKFGFFTEYTQESMDFDSDAELMMHLTQEVVKAANELTEDQLQIDLINGAGVIRYAGNAVSLATLDADDPDNTAGSSVGNDVVSYDDLVKLGIELDQNRTPKNTKIIAGSRMVDTKVVNAARYIYIGSELVPSIMRMTDYHSNKAFIPVAQYASAGNVAKGEIGAVDNFRFIVVPEMMHKEGVGVEVLNAEEETNLYRFGSAADGSGLHYNAYPMLVVGDGSFTTIGFQTDGKTVKFKTKHVKPEQNYSTDDPYGETGFYSIKWYYGSMILRPERLAILWTLAEW